MDKLLKVAVITWVAFLALLAGMLLTANRQEAGADATTSLPAYDAGSGGGRDTWIPLGLWRTEEHTDRGVLREAGPESGQCNCLYQGVRGGEGRGEDPDEDALITAALEEQGYFRADVPLDYELQDVLHTAAEANGVPYHVALGLIYVESRFDPEAVSPAGCRGLCQLHPRYFPADLTPAENIEAGMEYLGSLIERCGDLSAALTAYHAGSDTGDRAYADQVMRAAEVWDAQMHTEAESFGGEILQKEAGI